MDILRLMFHWILKIHCTFTFTVRLNRSDCHGVCCLFAGRSRLCGRSRQLDFGTHTLLLITGSLFGLLSIGGHCKRFERNTHAERIYRNRLVLLILDIVL